MDDAVNIEVKSWKPEVIADSSNKWVGNGLRFATEAEAMANARDLMGRWTMVLEYRAAPSEDPPKHRWVDGRVEDLPA